MMFGMIPSGSASRQSAFSLLELTVSIVIIGLLLGLTIAGKEWIAQARLRGVMEQADRYAKAVGLFKDQYLALPGDMKNATTLWGEAHATAATCKITVGTGTQTCNGDGDGRITNQSSATTYFEQFRAWQQLSNAKLIEGNYSGVSTGGANTQTYTYGTNCPSASIAPGCFILQSLTATEAASQSSAFFPAYYGNYMRIAEGSSTGITPILKPSEAEIIDVKFDDGLPASGNVLSMRNPTTADCLTTDVAATAQYNSSSSSKLCVILLLIRS